MSEVGDPINEREGAARCRIVARLLFVLQHCGFHTALEVRNMSEATRGICARAAMLDKEPSQLTWLWVEEAMEAVEEWRSQFITAARERQP